MPRGRPQKDQIRIQPFIPKDLYFEMFMIYPELFKSQLPPEFQHGAITKYITSLIVKDISLQKQFREATLSSASRAE